MIGLVVDIPNSTQALGISGDGVALASAWIPPETRPVSVEARAWAFRSRKIETRNLAGHSGNVTVDVFTSMGLALTREVWQSEEAEALAVRMRLQNAGAMPIHVYALVPFQCDAGGLTVDGLDAGDWRVLAHNRFKNGIPSSFQPGVLDEDFKHVSRGMTEMGDVPEGEGRVEQVEMDPCALIRGHGTVLLIGFLSQTGHCARIRMQVATKDGQTRLRQLKAECEFDGVILPPGGERTSQWVFVSAGCDAPGLLADFADRVGAYHHVNPPDERPPSVFCSWQFYGESFTEADLREDLAHLEKERMPFDVFLIDDCWATRGDYEVNARWSSGMKDAAGRIAALGYRPGIWTCPFIARPHSQMALNHPAWLLRLKDGTPHNFPMGGPNYVLDPTYPGVCDFLEETFRTITHDWGFTYHKMDFMRAVFIDPKIQFYDSGITRLEAYRMGLSAIRRGAGPDAYLSVCGGHYGGSLGLANSQRSGSDVASCWHDPPALPKFKQNVLRTWMSRLWHVDPDAMMVRRRETVFRETEHGFLSLGKFSDAEAQTIAVNQYAGGGMVCLCEKFMELDEDRKALYRHVMPSIDSPGIPLNVLEPICPSLILTHVNPVCEALDAWVTVSAVNWTEESKSMSVTLDENVAETLMGDRFLVWEFFSQQAPGIYERGAVIDLGAGAPHTSRILRIAPWDGVNPTLAGTDLHFSGGGVEVADWRTSEGEVRGRIETRWWHPVKVFAAFPTGDGFAVKAVEVGPGNRTFQIER